MTTAYTRWRKRAWLLAFVLAVFAFAPGIASAQLIDPSTLQIGQGGSTTDPVRIGGSGFVTITQVSGGAGVLTEPILLILGIPNPTSNFSLSNSSITSVTTTNTSSTTSWSLGGTTPSWWSLATSASFQSSGYAGSMTAGGEAYSTIGLNGTLSSQNTNSSESFTNWAGADQKYNNITPTSFGIYVFEINAALASKDTVSIQFANGALPLGSYAIAYGVNIDKKNGNTAYDTPFTEAGLTTGSSPPPPPPPAVPEPSTMALALTGLVGFGLARVRRFRRQKGIL